MSLKTYHQKRQFQHTPEPKGQTSTRNGPLSFVVQKHHASQLHYDFRLELHGVLKSWAVPKGPSMNPKDKRLAMLVEDHPLEYANFEGMIPKGNYGAGTVMVWDKGIYSPLSTTDRRASEKILEEQFNEGHITIALLGEKLRGEFALVRTKFKENTWLLIKANDQYASAIDVRKQERSATTNLTLDEIAKRYKQEQPLDLSGTPKTTLPKGMNPMLAQTADAAFDNPDWIYEIKWDGYRAIAEVNNKVVKLNSRNHISYNQRFAPIAESLSTLGHKAVLDGEIVALDTNGQVSFQALQDYPNSPASLIYYVFDIAYLDGHDVTQLPLLRRKEILRSLLPDKPNIRMSEFVVENGKKFFSAARKMKLEGIMAKHTLSPYLPGERSNDWLKIKTSMRQEAIIAGFTRPNGNRKHFGALVLGVYKRGKLTYVGHTGGGFNDGNLESIIKKLQPLITDECPFGDEPKTNAPVTWVKPVLMCEVTFKQWTNSRQMRHPVFVGMRDDKNPQDVVLEGASASSTAETAEITLGKHTLTLTHPDKIFWPKEKYTKTDLFKYYTEISPYILPYLKDRPQSLLRFPHGIKGESFFQKDVGNLSASWLKKVDIKSESTHKVTPFLLCQDLDTLLYMVNLGCIDFNPWNSRAKQLDNPDYLIFDLDPEHASFDKVITVAIAIREMLEGLDIESFCKTSGKRGMHIYIPMGAKYSYEQVRQFAQLLCLRVQAKLPKLVSLLHDPDKRRGKVYLDYLRNGRHQTTASVYSVRAYPGATVSTPLKWSEVTKRLSPDTFTIKTVSKRFEKHGDLFKGVLGKGINMEKIVKRIDGAK